MRSYLMALILTAVLAAALAAAVPLNGALAQESQERDPVEEMAREGIEQMMKMLNAIMNNIPQYEMPEVNENGDIIIRRKRKEESGRQPESEPELDSTDT